MSTTKRAFKIEKVTPAKAQQLLRNNKSNRRLSQRVVNDYAQQMKDGEWQFNGETVCISKTGRLLSGQHRLSAVVLSGETVEMAFAYGIDEKAMKTMDTGKPRNNADHLQIHGFNVPDTYYPTIAAAMRIIWNFNGSGVYGERKNKLTSTKAISFLEKNKRLLHSMEFIGEQSRSESMVPLSIMVAMHYLFSKDDKEKADAFFTKFISGAGLGATSPILALRNRVMVMEGNRHGKNIRKMFITYFILAYRSYKHNKPLSVQSFQYRAQNPIVLDFKKRK